MSGTARHLICMPDTGKDPDDEMTLFLLAGLRLRLQLALDALIIDHPPTLPRAQLTEGTARLLHLPYGVLAINHANTRGILQNGDCEAPYSATTPDYPDVLPALRNTLDRAADNSITMLVIAQQTTCSLATAAISFPDLFAKKVAHVVLMAGAHLIDGVMVPDDSANNMFDMEAAVSFFGSLQTVFRKPITLVTRYAARTCAVDKQFVDKMGQSKNPAGQHVCNRYRTRTRILWKQACSPAGSDVREGLPDNRDRDWFIKTFCDWDELNSDLRPQSDIWPHVKHLLLYDPLAMLVATGSFDDWFNPKLVTVNGVTHKIIGFSPDDPGVLAPKRVVKFMEKTILHGLDV